MSTARVARFITDISFERLPPEVLAQAKTAIRDNLGVMLAANLDPAAAAVRRTALAMGGYPESTLVGTGARVPCNLAAMANSVLARALDMDDGACRRTGQLAHVGGIVVPSALAAVERQKASGKRLIETVVAAYEVDLRAGWLISLWNMAAPAGMAGTYGAAAAAAKAWGFDEVRTRNTLGVAEAHCPHASRAVTAQRMYMTSEAEGWGAMTGVTAALLAAAGLEGPDTIFDLQQGRGPLETLGREWEMMRLYFKPYSSCRFTHAPVDGLLRLMEDNHLLARDIVQITVGVAAEAASMASYRPSSVRQAQCSIPFTLGAALAHGEVTPLQVSDMGLGDESILAEATKVKVVSDPEAERIRPGTDAARVKVLTVYGQEHNAWIPFPRGSPEYPMTCPELEYKFLSLAGRVMGEVKARELGQMVGCLEQLDDVTGLVEMIRTIP